jgi:dolichyl-phosphate beta-glucosyltransferase
VTARRTLSVVVPAHNERRRLPAALAELTDARWLEEQNLTLQEILVVDDGSSDDTAAIADRRGVCVIRLDRHRGKGAAVRAGMRAARGELALLCDADMATPFRELPKLLAAIDAGADVAIGSRALAGADIAIRQPIYRETAGKTFNVLFRLGTGLPYRDTQCGFKLFRLAAARPVFELQRLDGFAYDAENVVTAVRLGLRVDEVPVRWADDRDTRVQLVASSLAMAADLAKIAWWARRPLRQRVAVAERARLP